MKKSMPLGKLVGQLEVREGGAAPQDAKIQLAALLGLASGADFGAQFGLGVGVGEQLGLWFGEGRFCAMLGWLCCGLIQQFGLLWGKTKGAGCVEYGVEVEQPFLAIRQ